jgi:hypothetical protein
MIKDKEKKSLIAHIIIFILFGIGLFFGISVLELGILVSILISIGISFLSVFLLFPFLEKRDKDKEKIDFKDIQTLIIKKTIKDNEEYNKQAEKEIDKRKEHTTKELIGKEFRDWIENGVMLFALGIILLGAIPAYFGVQDVSLNDSITVKNGNNLTLGFNNSLDLVKDGGYKFLITLHDLGSEHPAFWFWFWWLSILFFFISPILSIIGLILKSKFKLKYNYLNIWTLFGLSSYLKNRREVKTNGRKEKRTK